VAANILHGQVKVHLGAENGLLKRYLYGCFNVLAPVAAAAAALAAAEKTAEYVTEPEVAEIKAKVLGAGSKTAKACERVAVAGGSDADAGVTKLVLELAFRVIL
jgi:hypothetical protein